MKQSLRDSLDFKIDFLKRSLAFHNSPFPARKTHVCGIWRRNRLIAVGYNSRKSHPIQSKYKSRNERIFLHAELSAIHSVIRTRGVSYLQHCTLVVIRLDAEGNEANSRPCIGCLRAIKEFGLKDFYHT